MANLVNFFPEISFVIPRLKIFLKRKPSIEVGSNRLDFVAPVVEHSTRKSKVVGSTSTAVKHIFLAFSAGPSRGGRGTKLGQFACLGPQALGTPKILYKSYKISFFYVLGAEEGRQKGILPRAPKKLWAALLPRKKTKCYYWGIERLKKPVIHLFTFQLKANW